MSLNKNKSYENFGACQSIMITASEKIQIKKDDKM
jgi:hypothetical protein